MDTYIIYTLHHDGGSVVLFEAARADEYEPTTLYLIAVDHLMAQAIIDEIDAGSAVEVEPESWQIVGTVR